MEFRASSGWMEKFKKRYGIRLKSSRGEKQTTDNIAFDYDDINGDATGMNEVKLEFDLKPEGVLYEPAFVTVNDFEDDVATAENNETADNNAAVMRCVDEVIAWSVAHKIEPLYLTMLKSLRERIRYQARH